MSARHGHKEIGQLVLEHGADVKTQNTALFAAVMWGHRDVLSLLLDQGAEIEATDSHGATPLILAVWKGEAGIARYLIDHRANVNARDLLGEMALTKGILEHLLRRGASKYGINQSKLPLILSASEHSSERILTILLQDGADINGKAFNGVCPLISALVQCNNSEYFFTTGLRFRKAPGLFWPDYDDYGYLTLHFYTEHKPLEKKKENGQIFTQPWGRYKAIWKGLSL